MIPAPYQPGPPQEYLEAVTNKRLTEEVRWWRNEICVVIFLMLICDVLAIAAASTVAAQLNIQAYLLTLMDRATLIHVKSTILHCPPSIITRQRALVDSRRLLPHI